MSFMTPMTISMNTSLSPDQVRLMADREAARKKGEATTPLLGRKASTSQSGLSGNPSGEVRSELKPLFQRCIDLIATLYSFPLFEFYLFPDGLDAYLMAAPLTTSSDSQSLPAIADPVEVLWNCFKLGAPLCVIYNELAATSTGSFLNPDDVSGIRPPFYPSKPCKDNLYKFITACRSEMNIPQALELSGVSELYKDDTAGFMKFLKLVEELIIKIDRANNLPAPKELPFSTQVSKDLSNPLDNRSRLIKELVETERAYIFSLEELQRYQNELAQTKVFSKDMMYGLFSNLNELLDFQRRFMVGMESTLNLGLVEQRIGQLFIHNEDAFEVYFPFCGNYQVAQNAALAQAEDLKHLGHIIQPNQIQSYLIKPLQRLMRYPLLLRELIKLTDPETYPYMEELREGLESIKRVTDKLNEVQRQDENDRTKLDLAERMEDWKGLQIRDFGDLLLVERFPFMSDSQEREYYMFLFEKILLCCKKDLKTRARSSRKRSDAGTDTYCYSLRGNIYINSIVSVQDSSDPSIGAFSICVYWKEASGQDAVCFSLKCRTEEQVLLWTRRLESQIELFRRRKSSAGNPPSPYQSIMDNRSNHGYSGYFDPNVQQSLHSAGSSIYPISPAAMTRTLSNPHNRPNYGQASPNMQYQQSQGAGHYDQQPPQTRYIMQNGVMLQVPQQFVYSPQTPVSPNSYDHQRMREMGGGGGYAVGPDLRPLPRSRTEFTSSGPNTPPSSAGISKSREALNALASMASTGLPIAGFSDDEEDSESGGEEEVYSTRGFVTDLPRHLQGMQGSGRKPSFAIASVTERRGSPGPPPVSLGQTFQFPPQSPGTASSPGSSGFQQRVQSRPATGPQVMRRAPTAPAYLNMTTSSTSPNMQKPQHSSSFIKIRAHYDGDVLIIAMPVRGATLQELRNRVERKVNLMPHKPMLSNPIQMIVKEEVQFGSEGAKEWRVVGVLESDEDVGRAFATNIGMLDAKQKDSQVGDFLFPPDSHSNFPLSKSTPTTRTMQAPAPIEEEAEIKYNPVSPAAMQKNNHIILYARSTLALSCGAAAGILGLTGTTGFLFFFAASLVMSLALVAKTGMSPDRYFPLNNGLLHLATSDVLNSLSSYLLFWTLFTGLVHLFE
ncbi:hypothetical protein HDU98_000604 [Podochytrium sp. JEL0797]|nr:hypothetical protein HDU98_000604 [Podochytrium sp. JEL0797]